MEANFKKVIGLTGYTGCGKSFVSRQFHSLLSEKGFQVEVIDADKLAKQIRDESNGAKKLIKEILGPQVYDEKGISIPTVCLMAIADLFRKLTKSFLIPKI